MKSNGPFSTREWGNKGTEAYLTQIVADENAAGDKNVRLFVFETQDAKNGFGADWHPSVKTDQIMADKLAATLETDLVGCHGRIVG